MLDGLCIVRNLQNRTKLTTTSSLFFLENTSIGCLLICHFCFFKWQYDSETVFLVAVVDFRVEINVFRTHPSSSTGIPAKRSGRRVSTLVGGYIFTLTSIVPPLQRKFLVAVFVRQSSPSLCWCEETKTLF